MTLRQTIRHIILALAACSYPASVAAEDISTADDDFDVFLSAVEASSHIGEDLQRELLAGEITTYANSFLGRPYRRGGKGPKAFDCSGFTSYIFRQFDTPLGASSRSQFQQGKPIDRQDIRPGDLVFFSTYRTARSGSVGHVGIAVDVAPDGRVAFIHAAHRGGIRVDYYPDGGYYSKHYIGARRVINHINQ